MAYDTTGRRARHETGVSILFVAIADDSRRNSRDPQAIPRDTRDPQAIPRDTRDPQTVSRDTRDACPGALQTHAAADGELARVRVPGGALSVAQLRALADAASDLGGGVIELTSRANVQVRALRDAAAFAVRMGEAGLLPSATHERVRNIVASPLAGRARTSVADIRPLVGQLDRALCARPELASLPGRFLFALDDGTGDMLALEADVTLAARADGFVLLLAGVPVRALPRPAAATLAAAAAALPEAAAVVALAAAADLAPPAAALAASPHAAAAAALAAADAAAADTVGVALAAAEVFVAKRGGAWRIAELPDGAQRIAAHLPGSGAPEVPQFGDPPRGVIPQRDGRVALEVVVPLGRLTSAQARVLADVAVGEVRLTPWRTVVLPDLGSTEDLEAVLGAHGLITDPASPHARLSACVGRPGCAKSHADVQADAMRWAETVVIPEGTRVHWSGCERRCGRPKDRVAGGVTGGVSGGVSDGVTGGVTGGVSGGVTGGVHDIVATPTGYVVATPTGYTGYTGYVAATSAGYEGAP
ncbi:precorrin-3B synthase [Streptosporangiaceae bacterium NEAU-GS5]|nr:precorrin-3B synthase [Streptosporangiaceae bacterium NEAU-GS5]